MTVMMRVKMTVMVMVRMRVKMAVMVMVRMRVKMTVMVMVRMRVDVMVKVSEFQCFPFRRSPFFCFSHSTI